MSSATARAALLLGLGVLAAVPAFAQGLVCDVDLDGDVDRLDIGQIFAARNTPASGPSDPRDANGDGFITVNDGSMCVAQCTQLGCPIITPTANTPPVADAGMDQSALTGASVVLDGSGSYDPDGGNLPLTYAWGIFSAPGGSNAFIADPAAPITSFIPDISGEYIVELVVSDGQASSTPDFATITVIPGGGEPDLEATPNPLDFGTVTSGTQAIATLTLTNVGDGTADGLTGGTPSDARFELLSTTCQTLGPGQSCTFDFSFVPTVNGLAEATATITTLNAGSVVIDLLGTGIGSPLWVTPLALDFGPVGVGQLGTSQAVTITNQGSTTITGWAGGGVGGGFSAAQNCAAGLAPGASCQFFYNFVPTAAGDATTTSNVFTSAGSFVIELNGRGVGPGLHVSPTVIDFGPLGVGQTSASVPVNVTNTGAATLTNFAGGGVSAPFGAAQNCAAGVAPGATCQFFYTFSPSAAGAATTTSNVFTNAGNFSIELRGTGVGPEFSVSPLALDFGPVVVGTTGPTQTVTIRNTGDVPLTGWAGGGVGSGFGAAQNCAGGVAPGGSCQFLYTFTPTATGAASTSSNVFLNGGSFSISLTGTGVPPGGGPVGPGLWVTPLSLDFGHVGLGQTAASQSVTVTNTGTATLSSFAGGGVPAPFGAAQNCAAGVPPGGSCSFIYNFTPTADGVATGTSTVFTNAGSFAISLTGTGEGPAVTASPLEIDFGRVGVGQTSASVSVTVRNTGEAALSGFAGGGVGAGFGAAQNCAAGVPVGGSCQFFYNFTPTAVGPATTTSSVFTNGGNFVVTLRGVGAGPELWVTPTKLAFGTVPAGTTSPSQSATITNTGQSTLTSFAGGGVPAPFGAAQNCAGGVPPGGSCQFIYNFSPPDADYYEGQSNVFTNGGSFVIELEGGAD